MANRSHHQVQLGHPFRQPLKASQCGCHSHLLGCKVDIGFLLLLSLDKEDKDLYSILQQAGVKVEIGTKTGSRGDDDTARHLGRGTGTGIVSGAIIESVMARGRKRNQRVDGRRILQLLALEVPQ